MNTLETRTILGLLMLDGCSGAPGFGGSNMDLVEGRLRPLSRGATDFLLEVKEYL